MHPCSLPCSACAQSASGLCTCFCLNCPSLKVFGDSTYGSPLLHSLPSSTYFDSLTHVPPYPPSLVCPWGQGRYGLHPLWGPARDGVAQSIQRILLKDVTSHPMGGQLPTFPPNYQRKEKRKQGPAARASEGGGVGRGRGPTRRSLGGSARVGTKAGTETKPQGPQYPPGTKATSVSPGPDTPPPPRVGA